MNLEFNENQGFAPQRTVSTSGSKGLTGLLIQIGVARDVPQAKMVELIVVIICFLIIVLVFMFGGSDRDDYVPTGIDPETGLPLDHPDARR